MSELQPFFNQHKPKSTHGIFDHFLDQVDGQGGIAYDLCCGTGFFTAALAQRGYTAFGVDLADGFIGEDGADANRYIVGDVNDLPLTSGAASLVTCVDSLQYFSDPAAIIREMARLLRPDGQLILSTQNNYNPAGIKKWLIKRMTGRDWSPWLLHPVENFVTYPWLMETLAANDLEVEYVRGKQFLTAWVSVLPSFVRHAAPTDKPWRSLSGIAGRTHLPQPIEESGLARFAMIVLISARKKSST